MGLRPNQRVYSKSSQEHDPCASLQATKRRKSLQSRSRSVASSETNYSFWREWSRQRCGKENMRLGEAQDGTSRPRPAQRKQAENLPERLTHDFRKDTGRCD